MTYTTDYEYHRQSIPHDGKTGWICGSLMDLEEEARETARIRAENGDDEMRLAVDDDVDEDDQDPMRIDQHTAEVSTRVQDEPAAQQRKRKWKQKQKPVKKRASARTSKPSRRVREAAAINSPCART